MKKNMYIVVFFSFFSAHAMMLHLPLGLKTPPILATVAALKQEHDELISYLTTDSETFATISLLRSSIAKFEQPGQGDGGALANAWCYAINEGFDTICSRLCCNALVQEKTRTISILLCEAMKHKYQQSIVLVAQKKPSVEVECQTESDPSDLVTGGSLSELVKQRARSTSPRSPFFESFFSVDHSADSLRE